MKHTYQRHNTQGEQQQSLRRSLRSRRRLASFHRHASLWIKVTIVVMVVAFSVIVYSRSGITAAAEQSSNEVTHAPLQRASSQIVGSPAIRPTRKQIIPSFSSTDVVTYMSGRPLARTLSSSKLSSAYMTVQFLPSKMVSARLLGEPTGLPDSTLLCLVIAHGTFTFSGPEGTMVTYPVGYEVFDARTGNLLMWGGLPSSA